MHANDIYEYDPEAEEEINRTLEEDFRNIEKHNKKVKLELIEDFASIGLASGELGKLSDDVMGLVSENDEFQDGPSYPRTRNSVRISKGERLGALIKGTMKGIIDKNRTIEYVVQQPGADQLPLTGADKTVTFEKKESVISLNGTKQQMMEKLKGLIAQKDGVDSYAEVESAVQGYAEEVLSSMVDSGDYSAEEFGRLLGELGASFIEDDSEY